MSPSVMLGGVNKSNVLWTGHRLWQADMVVGPTA